MMQDIKFFFSIKIIKQSGGQQIFPGGQITENITKNHYFSKSKGVAPQTLLDPPLTVYPHITITNCDQ
jgi:hypothetical protein